jgi:superfamily II DNA or RNA helicase
MPYLSSGCLSTNNFQQHSLPPLRSYQKEAVRAILKSIQHLDRMHVLELPPGAGKTRTANEVSLPDTFSGLEIWKY